MEENIITYIDPTLKVTFKILKDLRINCNENEIGKVYNVLYMQTYENAEFTFNDFTFKTANNRPKILVFIRFENSVNWIIDIYPFIKSKIKTKISQELIEETITPKVLYNKIQLNDAFNNLIKLIF